MDKALRMAVRMLRDHVKPGPRAVVLFTSGPDNVTASYDVDGAVKQLEIGSARIYVVAIGPKVRNYQVRPLVNSSDDVIKISTFLKLYSELHMVGRYIALAQGKDGIVKSFPKHIISSYGKFFGGLRSELS